MAKKPMPLPVQRKSPAFPKSKVPVATTSPDPADPKLKAGKVPPGVKR